MRCWVKIICLVAAFSPGLLRAETFWLRSSSGEYGSEDGTSYANAFDGPSDISWGSGAGNVGAGDILYVCGALTENLTLGADGTAGNPLVIDGRCPEETGSIDVGSSAVHAITYGTSGTNDDYITIQYITLAGGTTSTVHCNNGSGGCSNNILDHITCSNSNAGDLPTCLTIRAPIDSSITNNTLDGNGLAGRGIILDNGSSGQTGTSNNDVSGNDVEGFINVGIRLSGLNDANGMQGPNYIHDNYTHGNGSGIYHTRADDVRTYLNRSDGNTLTSGSGEGYGYACEECNRTMWYGNTGTGNRTHGIQVWADGTRTSDYTFMGWNYLYANNTGGSQFIYACSLANGSADPSVTTAHTGAIIVANICSGTGGANFFDGDSAKIYNNYFIAEDSVYEQAGVVVQTGADNLDFENNVFVGQGGAYAVWDTGITNVTRKNNHYYITSGTTVANVGSGGGATKYTSVTLSTFDATASYGDPLVDENYQPSVGSPLLNSGVHVNPRYDFRAATCISGTPDIGPYCNDVLVPYGYTLRPNKRR